uniref:VM domain-containing protein n=1 Tax=Glossina austeni TaxID=7395 RepID=A0A1A9UI76_GLOAU
MKLLITLIVLAISVSATVGIFPLFDCAGKLFLGGDCNLKPIQNNNLIQKEKKINVQFPNYSHYPPLHYPPQQDQRAASGYPPPASRRGYPPPAPPPYYQPASGYPPPALQPYYQPASGYPPPALQMYYQPASPALQPGSQTPASRPAHPPEPGYPPPALQPYYQPASPALQPGYRTPASRPGHPPPASSLDYPSEPGSYRVGRECITGMDAIFISNYPRNAPVNYLENRTHMRGAVSGNEYHE